LNSFSDQLRFTISGGNERPAITSLIAHRTITNRYSAEITTGTIEKEKNGRDRDKTRTVDTTGKRHRKVGYRPPGGGVGAAD